MQISTPLVDTIDRIRAEWRRELPALDTSPLATMGRVLRAQVLTAVAIRRALRSHGLDLAGFDVLATLRRSGPPYRLSPTRLYQALALTSGAMTHRVDALERAGLVERRRDRGDRRANLAGLTPRGRAVVERAMRAHMAAESAIVARLSAAERAQLARLLKKLLLALEKSDARRL